MFCESKQSKQENSTNSQERPDSQKRTRDQYSSSTIYFKKQTPQNFETGITLDEYFGTTFKPLSQRFIIKEKDFENNSRYLPTILLSFLLEIDIQSNNNSSKFLKNIQINETDEDQYTESNCISTKISRQQDSKAKEDSITQFINIPPKATKLNPPSKLSINTIQLDSDFDNHIALRNANLQILRSSQYGQSFLQVAQNLQNQQIGKHDLFRKVSLEKSQCKLNHNKLSTNQSHLNQNMYATNYSTWSRRKNQLEQKNYQQLSCDPRNQKSLNDRLQMKKLSEKGNISLLLKYADKFNFNLDECKEIIGNDLKGKAIFDKVIGIKHFNQRQNNIFLDNHIQI